MTESKKTPARPTLKAVRGTRDLLPDQTPLWNHVEATARALFARYGFGEIRTPIFETTELFARGVGEETDIVSKEMFTWEDGERFDKDLLRGYWYQKNEVRITHGLVRPNDFVGAYINGYADNTHESATSEAVAFAGQADAKAIKQLEAADINPKDEDFSTLKLGSPIQLRRLVVPSPIPDKKEEWLTDTFVIEYVFGNFNKSSQSLTLRPESTAGVVRAYIEHKLGETGQLQKLYYIGPQFRRERPQRGRYRQFWQIGAEVIGPQSSGSESPLRDAEILEMLASLLDELGIRDWHLELNSVGSSEDRVRYNAALREALQPVKHLLCEDNQRRADTNPLRVLDSKEEADQDLINALPKIADYLGPESKAHFDQVLAALDACGVPYNLNPRLVRGLDYYTRTTFEAISKAVGAQSAVVAGGRYDGLVEALGGAAVAGTGFAIGVERIALALEADRFRLDGAPDAAIIAMGDRATAVAIDLAKTLRQKGLRVEMLSPERGLKALLRRADKVGARYAIIMGENELARGVVQVRDLKASTQREIANDAVAAEISVPAIA